jgi:hypothetical protein
MATTLTCPSRRVSTHLAVPALEHQAQRGPRALHLLDPNTIPAVKGPRSASEHGIMPTLGRSNPSRVGDRAGMHKEHSGVNSCQHNTCVLLTCPGGKLPGVLQQYLPCKVVRMSALPCIGSLAQGSLPLAHQPAAGFHHCTPPAKVHVAGPQRST